VYGKTLEMMNVLKLVNAIAKIKYFINDECSKVSDVIAEFVVQGNFIEG